jgi:predicted ester cyclase
MGMDPTGRAIKIAIVFLYDFRDGLIVTERRIYDFTSVLIQVGMLKAKPS